LTNRERDLLHIIDTQQKVIAQARVVAKLYRMAHAPIRPAVLNPELHRLETAVKECDRATGVEP
jgi:hypothetical protein